MLSASYFNRSTHSQGISSFLGLEQYTVYSQHRFVQCKSKGYRPFLKLKDYF